MIPLDVVSSGFDVGLSNGRGIVIFSEGPKVFGLPVMNPSFSFTCTNLKTIITIPALCFVHNSELLLIYIWFIVVINTSYIVFIVYSYCN